MTTIVVVVMMMMMMMTKIVLMKNIDMAAKRDYQDMNTQEQANEDSGQVLAESDSHQQVVDQNQQINEEEEETQEQQMQEENNNINEIEDNNAQEFETIEEIYDDIDNNESRPNNSKNIIKRDLIIIMKINMDIKIIMKIIIIIIVIKIMKKPRRR